MATFTNLFIQLHSVLGFTYLIMSNSTTTRCLCGSADIWGLVYKESTRKHLNRYYWYKISDLIYTLHPNPILPVSPLGLFSRAIMQSGSAISPWPSRGLRIVAEEVSKRVGCPKGIDSQDILACLQKVGGRRLAAVVQDFMVSLQHLTKDTSSTCFTMNDLLNEGNSQLYTFLFPRYMLLQRWFTCQLLLYLMLTRIFSRITLRACCVTETSQVDLMAGFTREDGALITNHKWCNVVMEYG